MQREKLEFLRLMILLRYNGGSMKIVIKILVFTSQLCKFDNWLARHCDYALDLLEGEQDDVE